MSQNFDLGHGYIFFVSLMDLSSIHCPICQDLTFESVFQYLSHLFVKMAPPNSVVCAFRYLKYVTRNTSEC